MLVGQENTINDKLVEEISQVFPISFRDINDVISGSKNNHTPRVIIMNLMDVDLQEEELLATLKNRYPSLKVIAIHCYQSPKLVQKTLNKGYDSYVSIFKLSGELAGILKKQNIIE